MIANLRFSGEFQKKWHRCSTCQKDVVTSSMGKYCVRFGANIKQFCSNVCLEDHKKGLKVCCFCQKDITGADGFLAPIGDKGQFKDFCAQACLKKYQVMHLGMAAEKPVAECSVCRKEKTVEVELVRPFANIQLCGRPCFSAYKFANSIDTLECNTCNKDYDLRVKKCVVHFDGQTRRFCSIACQNVYVMKHRKIGRAHV